MKKIIFFSFILTSTLYGQKFQLSNIYSEEYSIDRIAQQIYFRDFYSDTVRKVSLKNFSVVKTNFLISTPIFSNKRHLMVYRDSLYDIDGQLSYKFNDSQADSFGYMPDPEFPGSFSPNDSNFIYGNPKYYVSLNDSALKPIETNLSVYSFDFRNDADPQWSSDTSFVFLSIHDDAILEYFLYSNKLDTLTAVDTLSKILGFAYNTKYNILAYSTKEQKIFFHYKGNVEDSLIFSPDRDDSQGGCWKSGYVGITSLCWSQDNKKLAFINFQFIDISAAGIYLYSLDSNKIYRPTDCLEDGRKYHLRWANNDTLIYSNSTDQHLYGLDVSGLITSVHYIKDDQKTSDLSVSNYPNPFNNSTKISIALPDNVKGTFFIYDALGRLVRRYYLTGGKNKYEIIWDGLNDNKKSISSGFYFGILKEGDSKVRNTKTIKMIYLK